MPFTSGRGGVPLPLFSPSPHLLVRVVNLGVLAHEGEPDRPLPVVLIRALWHQIDEEGNSTLPIVAFRRPR